jgi:hypothetical protein
MKSVSKLIYALIFLGILLKAVKSFYVQNNMEYIFSEEVYGWYYRVGFYGNALISIAAILSFWLYRKYFPQYVTICYLIMILLVILASLNSMGEIFNRPNILYSDKGIGTFTNFGILFFAASTKHYPKILKLFYYLCFAFIIAGIVNLSKIGFGSSREEYLNAILNYAVYLIWVFPFFFLQDKDNKKINIINILIYLIIFIFVLSTGSRTYMVIYLLYFIMKFKNHLLTKNGILAVIACMILIVGVFSLFSNSDLAKATEGAFNILSERSAENTRSSQLIEFLDQYDTNYLLKGVGPTGTWYWSSVGRYYNYLDNQFLLLAWWAGLPTLLVYLFYLIKPIMQKSEIQLFENVKGLRMIIVLWILACAGFAIYVGISSDLYFDFITLLLGLQTCKFTLLRSGDEEPN